ncbi:hypothetical protein BH09MYX1_BH09MYX1_08230 [soil metagenome]
MRTRSTFLSSSLALLAPLCLAMLVPSAAFAQDAKPASSAGSAGAGANANGDYPPPPANGEAKPAEGDAKKITDGKAPIPPEDEWKITDVREKKGQSYYFVGIDYRVTIIPKFMVNLFVDEGATFVSNSVGLHFEVRKDNFSIIPAIRYVEYGFDPVLFLEKGKDPNLVGNWSTVQSTLKGIYATVDLMWSTPFANDMAAVEYGFGVGIGALFGDIYNNWVQKDPNGQLTASGGQRFSRCQTVGAVTSGCNPADHRNSDVNKVASTNPGDPRGYSEPTWAGGGSVPNVFAHLALPQLGIRFKPIKNLQARFSTAFTLTGFMFSFGLDFGLEFKKSPPPAVVGTAEAR